MVVDFRSKERITISALEKMVSTNVKIFSLADTFEKK